MILAEPCIESMLPSSKLAAHQFYRHGTGAGRLRLLRDERDVVHFDEPQIRHASGEETIR